MGDPQLKQMAETLGPEPGNQQSLEMGDEVVAGLLRDVEAEAVAQRLGTHLDKPSLSAAERAVAARILRVMLDNAEQNVRRIIADTLKKSPYLPHDMALTLANDVEAVALPIVAFSEVLTDDDLIAIINAGSEAKQTAIAGRAEVHREVADAIISTVNAAAVTTLVENRGAALDADLMERAATRFAADPGVAQSLRLRPDLPVDIAERLVVFTMDSLRGFIATRTNLSPEIVDQLVLRTREAAALDLIMTPYLPAAEAVRLVQHLHAAGRLTPSLVLRALCLGDIGLFEAAMARLAGIPVHNARLLIHDAGSRGLTSLSERAGMPSGYLPAIHAGLRFVSEMMAQGMDIDMRRFRRTMVERMLSRSDDLPDDMRENDLEYLLVRLNESAVSAARN